MKHQDKKSVWNLMIQNCLLVIKIPSYIFKNHDYYDKLQL